MFILLDVTIHNGGSRIESHRMGGAHDFKPLLSIDLIGAERGSNFVIKNFSRGARQCAKPSFF